MLYVLALLIGVVAGLRAMTAPAAVAWGAYLGWLPLAGTWAGFMGHWIAVAIFTVLALVELVTDQLPSTPSRKVPQPVRRAPRQRAPSPAPSSARSAAR